MKRFLLVLFFMFPLIIFSQELSCRVSINYAQIKTTNTQLFQAMQRDISEFMNTTRWTNYVFNNRERIDCSIMLNISAFDGVDDYTATAQVSVTRPVYDASLQTQVWNMKEKAGTFKFKYMENQPIEFTESAYTDELAYSLAFYAYLIIGVDFDTFAEMGGSEFFDKMQKIVSNAQTSINSAAWKSMGTNKEDNRYFLSKFLTSPEYSNFRIAQYKYHRLGLDAMTSDIMQGRQQVVAAIELMKQLYQKKPNSYLIQIWLESKRSEIINIFSEAPMNEAKKVAQYMQMIDPMNADKYNSLGQGSGNK